MKLELEEIKDEITQISKERDIDESRAFALFFLCRIHDLSEEEAEKIITDGPWNGGLDAFYYDDENRRLYLYQFKYTEDANYALSGIEDLVRAVREMFKDGGMIKIKNEKINFDNVDSIHVILVTLARLKEINGKAKKDFEKEKTKNLKVFFRRKNIDVDCKFEIFDYYKIEEILFGIGGIPEAVFDVSKGFLRAKDDTGNIEIIVALLKGEELAELCEKYGDDLFESNVRRFLGLRRGSVNWNILKTLENVNERNFFVAYNNGIVAVCKSFKIIEDEKKLILERFAIVNGAQTVNVLLKARERNFDFSNVYILAKIVRTQNWEIARNIARAANSQNPTNVRDLRSLDKVHKELEEIFSRFCFTYVYKRGIGLRRKSTIVNMKDLAQAYVAFYLIK